MSYDAINLPICHQCSTETTFKHGFVPFTSLVHFGHPQFSILSTPMNEPLTATNANKALC